MKTVMEMAFRELITQERNKNISKWPEGDVRRDITVVLWDKKERRKEKFERRKPENDIRTGEDRKSSDEGTVVVHSCRTEICD